MSGLEFFIQLIIFIFVWGFAWGMFFTYWDKEIENFIFRCKVGIQLTSAMLGWTFHGGTKYYIVRYRYESDEEGSWRVVEFPPIR